MSEIVACMGGWCGQRSKCAHHHSPSRTVAERLCGQLEEPAPMKLPPGVPQWLAFASSEQVQRYLREHGLAREEVTR